MPVDCNLLRPSQDDLLNCSTICPNYFDSEPHEDCLEPNRHNEGRMERKDEFDQSRTSAKPRGFNAIRQEGHSSMEDFSQKFRDYNYIPTPIPIEWFAPRWRRRRSNFKCVWKRFRTRVTNPLLMVVLRLPRTWLERQKPLTPKVVPKRPARLGALACTTATAVAA